jgi:hypothetical protein
MQIRRAKDAHTVPCADEIQLPEIRHIRAQLTQHFFAVVGRCPLALCVQAHQRARYSSSSIFCAGFDPYHSWSPSCLVLSPSWIGTKKLQHMQYFSDRMLRAFLVMSDQQQ